MLNPLPGPVPDPSVTHPPPASWKGLCDGQEQLAQGAWGPLPGRGDDNWSLLGEQQPPDCPEGSHKPCWGNQQLLTPRHVGMAGGQPQHVGLGLVHPGEGLRGAAGALPSPHRKPHTALTQHSNTSLVPPALCLKGESGHSPTNCYLQSLVWGVGAGTAGLVPHGDGYNSPMFVPS